VRLSGTTGGKTMDNPMTYKGYTAKIEYSEKDECLIGCVSNIDEPVKSRYVPLLSC
jgi:hypothetical protein